MRMFTATSQKEYEPPKGKGQLSLSSPDIRVPATTRTSHKTLPSKAIMQVLSIGNDFWVKKWRWRGSLKGCHYSLTTVAVRFARQGGGGRLLRGGASTLTYATRMPDWFPRSSSCYPVPNHYESSNFVSKIKVPTLMLAGGRDAYHDLLPIEMARKLADAAKARAKAKLCWKSSSIQMPSIGFTIKIFKGVVTN